MKLLVKKKVEVSQKRLKEAMSPLRYIKYETRLERTVHIVNDNVVRLVDGVEYGGISKKSLEHAVKAIKKRQADCKRRMENLINDSEEEGEKEEKKKKTVTLKTVHTFIKRHPELKSSLPKQVDINRLAASCQKVQKPWLSKLQTAERMQNATLVAGIAADGFSLPSVVLWPSATLPKELTTLLTPSLDIWPNTNGWMDKM
ncbi:putative DDE superfamily endoclease [Monocercomonoides exilis]|uniref:putative DDE superfamily endoclease n=1 Tax=Monocercomonoides exilis TaxID=2049356 RepID=UPI003559C098|nr:putative DDE superfamily endoclease [Monocercomonoides exilis]|eukprot:MONOS_4331.1-p1 / transcript=MONOS_4331.1 / gene=MONOS_4331 / organism=Monocercomonoides_exilis_PA203 / gene_product=DDE superfamily endoclease / transcript_product=DDE superfamily endoclease / location=Mono_scaffold00114:3322-4201(+) / protein_length=201 / sequence_SO=supercontig / SO=protein_coding / is_pseudo=false